MERGYNTDVVSENLRSLGFASKRKRRDCRRTGDATRVDDHVYKLFVQRYKSVGDLKPNERIYFDAMRDDAPDLFDPEYERDVGRRWGSIIKKLHENKITTQNLDVGFTTMEVPMSSEWSWGVNIPQSYRRFYVFAKN